MTSSANLLTIGYGLKLSNINGYTGEGTAKKDRFHKDGKVFLKSLADALGLPMSSYQIRSNKAGPAVSGEVTLHANHLYVQLSETCMRRGVSILYRSCASQVDYAGGTNHFANIEYMIDNPPAQARFINACRRVMAERAQAAA